MNVIVRPRQAGKTHALLEQMRADPTVKMVCISTREVERLEWENADLRGRFINWTSGPRTGAREALVVDNADLILASLFGQPIVGMSINE